MLRNVGSEWKKRKGITWKVKWRDSTNSGTCAGVSLGTPSCGRQCMEMHCTFRITCRNMQLFIFAALWSAQAQKVWNTSDAKKPELQEETRPLNECQAPGCHTTCGGAWKWCRATCVWSGPAFCWYDCTAKRRQEHGTWRKGGHGLWQWQQNTNIWTMCAIL